MLDGLVRAARSGRSAVLVVQGEPWIGKSALLHYVADAATACRVLRVSGVESEMELAFAGLQLGRKLEVEPSQPQHFKNGPGLGYRFVI